MSGRGSVCIAPGPSDQFVVVVVLVGQAVSPAIRGLLELNTLWAAC
jgi:hypothetical protein